jgi:D-alanine-D-alanine ligase
MVRKIGFTYNLKEEFVFKEDDPPDANAELDNPLIVEAVSKCFMAYGHQVERIGNAENLLKRLGNLDADIVFNIAEGYRGRNREAQIPIILEMAGIPFVGSDGLTLSLTLDKVMTKKVLMAEGIPTPKFVVASNLADLKDLRGLKFPLLAKPSREGSSKGISHESLVRSPAQLRERADLLIRMYKQPILVEEFIAGKEFTVALVENDPAQAFPVIQVEIDGKDDLGELFYTHEYIRSPALKYLCPARISDKESRLIREMALATYKAVDCLDFGRVDFRMDQEGNLYVLEINPLPSLSHEDAFNILARYFGIPFCEMINRILNAGLARYGMKGSTAVVDKGQLESIRMLGTYC